MNAREEGIEENRVYKTEDKINRALENEQEDLEEYYREHYSKRSKEETGKGQEAEAGTDKSNGSPGPEGAPEANEGDRGRDSEDDGGDEGVARRREPGEDDEEITARYDKGEEFKVPRRKSLQSRECQTK